MPERARKDWHRPPVGLRPTRLVLVFALISLVLFVSIGVGISRDVTRQFVNRGEETARLHAQTLTNSIVEWESVFGQQYEPLLAYAKSEVLRRPIEHLTIWRIDGTVVFSDSSSLMNRRFPLNANLREAFSAGVTVGGVADLKDSQSVTERGIAPRLYATYVPVWRGPQPSGQPLAVVEVFQDYASIANEANELSHRTFLVLFVGLGILWLLILPITHRLSNRLSRQYVKLREAEEKGQTERASLLDRTVQATEQERRRVALELHDGPVQHLSALDLILESVSLHLPPSDQSNAGPLVKKVQLRLRDEVTGLRRLMTELRPPALDERGLEAALRDHLNSVQARSGVLCTVDSTLIRRLDPTREIVLYRVAQEALTNVAKHARASHAWVSLRSANSHIELEIRDDGLGFDPSHMGDLVRKGHFGLIGMRERVEMAGGRWELLSRPAGGTIVRVVFPEEHNGDG